ncbi:ABC transporter permease [Desulfotalea psychrophila]|uniref:Related to sulfate ABC transporter, permease protein n=1 Tax=Desulfotalea psychrophila (strain LSv54 / DSM 12343) TaxID=177439 RepID=Q6AQT2_DESPS|nr:ABC transporter permease [Desulfotalea psychrophila]CAG35291.1 related to sulfate ABC transporter, permease protein [Desulfotalea psychrophila LSv54]
MNRVLSLKLFTPLCLAASIMVLLFIIVPLAEMILQPSMADLIETAHDEEVMAAIYKSLSCSGAAAMISAIFGTPIAYLLARSNFSGKKIVETIIDLPIMIPHPVVGIALLSLAGRNHPLGRLLQEMGFKILGTTTGIITVLTFVALPFYINTAKAGFQSVPKRLEQVARSLGAGQGATFFHITVPLTWRHMLTGFIMSMARAISEFGAVVIIAYHPMIAPILMYERFTAYGLKYSQPVAVLLIIICLFLFLLLRVVSSPMSAKDD